MGMALYRRHRPQRFSEVIGQNRVTDTIQQALKRGGLAHAYLFSGPRGTGKTTVARLLARAVNCAELKDGTLASGEPCNTCPACTRAMSGRELDLIEIDAASNRGIDEIRELRERIRFAPSDSRKKVFLIDEVHMLTKEAFNALLKTLEEPPEHALFILATTEAHSIPATILSRVQHFSFAALSVKDLVTTLTSIAKQESISAEPQALDLIAALAEGGARDALSLLDVIAAATQNEVTLAAVRTVLALPPQQRYEEWLQHIATGDTAAAVADVQRTYQDGNDIAQFARGLVRYVRLLMLCQIDPTLVAPAAPYLTKEQLDTVQQLSSQLAQAAVTRAIGLLNQAAIDMRSAVIPQLPLEVVSVQVAALASGSASVTRLVAGPKKTSDPVSIKTSDPAPVVTKPIVPKVATPAPAKAHVSSGRLPSASTSPELEPVDDAFLQTLMAGWSGALADVRQKNIGIGSLLKSAVVIRVGKTTARFAVEYAFHRDRIMARENRHLVEEILQQRFNRKLTLTCALVSGALGERGLARCSS